MERRTGGRSKEKGRHGEEERAVGRTMRGRERDGVVVVVVVVVVAVVVVVSELTVSGVAALLRGDSTH